MAFHPAPDRVSDARTVAADVVGIETDALITHEDLDASQADLGEDVDSGRARMPCRIDRCFASGHEYGLTLVAGLPVADDDDLDRDLVHVLDLGHDPLELGLEARWLVEGTLLEQPVAQLAFLTTGEIDHADIVGTLLDESECLQHRVVQVSGEVRSLFATDATAPLLEQLIGQTGQHRSEEKAGAGEDQAGHDNGAERLPEREVERDARDDAREQQRQTEHEADLHLPVVGELGQAQSFGLAPVEDDRHRCAHQRHRPDESGFERRSEVGHQHEHADHDHGEPPPHPAAPYRQLYRSRNDRKLGGVAGGLANYLGIDPTVVRIAFVVLALTGVSVLLYIAGWILIPEHPVTSPETVHQPPRGADRQLAVAVGIGSLGLAIAVLSGSWTLLAFALIVGGIWLLSERTRQADPPTPDPWPAAAAAAPGSPDPTPHMSATQPAIPYVEPPAPSPKRPQRITRGVLGLLALLVGLGIAAAAGDWWDVDGSLFLGIGTLIIGAGVILGAVTDLGARGLIPLGLLALILLIPVAVIDDLVDDGVGTATFRPSSIEDLEDVYRHGIGDMTVDLSRLDLTGEDHDVRVELGIGELTVLVADEVGGTVVLTADAGELDVDLPGSGSDRIVDGVSIESGSIVLGGEQGELDLEIDLGFGQAKVRSR